MASERILEQKKAVVEEIKNKLDNSKTFLLIDYRGLTVSEITELRRSLREMGSDIKVYKNTLMNLALKDKNIKLDDFMEGPNAYLFSSDIIEPIKVVSKFAKEHPALEIRAGYIDSEVVDVNTIKKYADIPSMEGLLTMFAGGLIEHLRNLSIGLNLYAEKLEKGGNE
jgi:large subunit ribosomal protein L10